MGMGKGFHLNGKRAAISVNERFRKLDRFDLNVFVCVAS